MAIEKLEQMTLSKAIRKVKTIKGELAQARERAALVVTRNTKDVVAWKFEEEKDRASSLAADLCILQSAIARTNALTSVTWKGAAMTLTLAVRTLAEIKSEIAWYGSLIVRPAVTTTTTHYENTYNDEGRLVLKAISDEFLCHLPEADRAREIEVLKADFEELNDIVETANHRTTLHDACHVSHD